MVAHGANLHVDYRGFVLSDRVLVNFDGYRNSLAPSGGARLRLTVNRAVPSSLTLMVVGLTRTCSLLPGHNDV